MSTSPWISTSPDFALPGAGLHAQPRVSGFAARIPDRLDGLDGFHLWCAVRDRHPRPIRYPAESRRIMVGTDFSVPSDLAVSLVAGIAASTDALVDLVHVFDGFSQAFVRGEPSVLDRVDAILDGVARELRARVRAATAQGARCVSTSLVGAPGLELTRHARETGADLLVLGLVGQTGGDRIGRDPGRETAAQVVRLGVWRELRPMGAPLAGCPPR
jgi:nucleotide-binding universal stress UspA family protein